jgi:carnitine O-acetyltransferase
VEFPKRSLKTYECQQLLPRLPVPSFSDTCTRYLKSVQPFLNSKQYERTEKIVQDFLVSESGQHLQHLLLNKAAKASTSWLEQWWNDLAYLTVRDPILINVNYGYGFRDDVRTTNNIGQSKRAALLIEGLLKFKQLLETETLEPDKVRSTPLCMVQYRYLFGTCRIPQETKDRVETVDISNVRYIIVVRNGQFYVLDVIDRDGTLLPVHSIES